MSEDNFNTNWLKIMKFNKNIDFRASEVEIEKLRIPFTPIKVHPKIIYHLFELFYPKFVTDQKNALDLIISDNGTSIKGVYLYEMDVIGIHEDYKKLPNDIIVLKEEDLEDLEELFNKLQMNVFESTNVRISSLRIFKESAISLMTNLCSNIEDKVLDEYVAEIFEVFNKILKNDFFILYPEPNIFRFLKNLLEFLENVKVSSFLSVLFNHFPEFNTIVVIHSEDLDFIFHIQKELILDGSNPTSLNLYLPLELGFKEDSSKIEKNLEIIKEKLHAKNIYYFNSSDIITFLSNLFEIEFPLNKREIELLLQKALYGFRKIDLKWKIIPKPPLYNALIRFFLRLFGFNVNLRKISHWSIPSLLFNTFDSYFGLKSKVLFILTDRSMLGNDTYEEEQLIENFRTAVMFETENSSIIKILQLNVEDIFPDSEFLDLEQIHTNLSKKFGYLSAIIQIDLNVIMKVIENYFINFSSKNPFPKYKILKLLKDEKNFQMFPELPPFQLFKEKGKLALLRLTLPLLIDKHEF